MMRPPDLDLVVADADHQRPFHTHLASEYVNSTVSLCRRVSNFQHTLIWFGCSRKMSLFNGHGLLRCLADLCGVCNWFCHVCWWRSSILLHCLCSVKGKLQSTCSQTICRRPWLASLLASNTFHFSFDQSAVKLLQIAVTAMAVD